MPTLVLKDRVKVTSTTTGTGNFTLGAASTGYQGFTAVGDGNQTYYCIAMQGGAQWEVGYGEVADSGVSLYRQSVYANSLGDTSFIDFPSGTKEVFCTYPAEQAIYQEVDGSLKLVGGVIGLTEDGTEGTTLPNTSFQAFTTGDYYMQANQQNLSDGPNASSDWVCTADNGSDTENYIDTGMASSGYNYAAYSAIKPNSGYLLSTGSDLRIICGKYGLGGPQDIVFIAALFHDIAKGRGGDHSELGAEDAIEFGRAHGFTERECKLIAWLIQNHLLMSLTAQKKDISDPDVVKDFAEKLGDMEHLDYLYTLTVADINATNPKLWNTWRASLMRQLYTHARDVIRTGLGRPVDYQMLIEDTKFAASELLVNNFALADVEKVWQELGDEYFIKESADEIAWHTQAILKHGDNPEPLVLLRAHRKAAQDAVQIFIYTRDQPNLFATTVAVLDRMNLDVQDAKIITASTAFSLDTYVVLDRFGTLLTDPEREETVKTALVKALSQPDQYP